MSSKTKIIVLHMKEIIYTAIFAILGIFILCLLFFMFSTSPASSMSEKKYTPGVYSSSFTLGNSTLNLEVAVSDSSINSIRISNLNEAVTTMYPLLAPSLENLADQICHSQSLENLDLPEENPYTSQLLINAIDDALKKAAAN